MQPLPECRAKPEAKVTMGAREINAPVEFRRASPNGAEAVAKRGSPVQQVICAATRLLGDLMDSAAGPTENMQQGSKPLLRGHFVLISGASVVHCVFSVLAVIGLYPDHAPGDS